MTGGDPDSPPFTVSNIIGGNVCKFVILLTCNCVGSHVPFSFPANRAKVFRKVSIDPDGWLAGWLASLDPIQPNFPAVEQSENEVGSTWRRRRRKRKGAKIRTGVVTYRIMCKYQETNICLTFLA
jgi:hypothetical protein